MVPFLCYPVYAQEECMESGSICDRFVALKTRLNVLMCVDRLLDCLNKMSIIDDILPFLAEIQTTDVDVIMSLVGQCVLQCSVHIVIIVISKPCHLDN